MQLPQDVSGFRPAAFATPRKSVEDPRMTQAKALEASFLSEMLGYAGIGKTDESFGGGVGEDQFASFLRDEQAKQMVAKGGIGLAEQLFKSLAKGADNAG